MFKHEFFQRLLRIANVAKRVVLQGFAQESKCVQGCIFVDLLGILNVTKTRFLLCIPNAVKEPGFHACLRYEI